jgi:enhancing lycopene biosynthesis protein 2
MQKKVAVILSGCGYLDGSEITEAVSVLIGLSQNKVSYQVFAPNQRFAPTSHFKDELLENQVRNALEESARITRGKIQDISDLNPSVFDGLVIPGGYGVVKNLCTWAQDGHKCSVNKDARRVIEAFFEASKPILAICIAPALVARILGQKKSITLTIGNNKDTAAKIVSAGCEHVECAVDDYITDRESKVISTPAYMYDDEPYKIFSGIQKAITEFLGMA